MNAMNQLINQSTAVVYNKNQLIKIKWKPLKMNLFGIL